MKKNLYVMNIGDYNPQMTALTMPLFKHYAMKIRAELFEITEVKFPDKPMVYEKFQIWKLAHDHPADWHIYLDIDTAIHPNFPDFVEYYGKNTVASYRKEPAMVKYVSDEYFRRDGRFIGIGGFFTAASDWCLDFWHPLDDLTTEEAMTRIHTTIIEQGLGIPARHLFEEYVLSRNLAKYGLKHETILDVFNRSGLQHANYLWHAYGLPPQDKLERLRALLDAWGV
jgi:hypothetical protein